MAAPRFARFGERVTPAEDEEERVERQPRFARFGEQVGGQTPQQTAGRRRGEAFGQVLGTMLQSLPMGLQTAPESAPRALGIADELAGLGGAATTAAGNLLRGRDEDVGQAFRGATDVTRERIAQQREELGPLMMGQDVAAGVGMTLLGGQAVKQAPEAIRGLLGHLNPATAPGALSATARTAAVGAPVGAAIGAAESDEDRLMGAGIGGGIGVLTAPLMPLASVGVRQGANLVDSARRAMGQNIPTSSPAERRAAQQIGLDREAVQQMPARPEVGGEMVAEMSPQGRSALVGLGRGADEASEVVAEAISARRMNRTQNFMNEVQSLTGSRRAVDAIADQQEAIARSGPLFDAAREAPIPMSGRSRELVRELAQRGVPVSGADMASPRGQARLSAFVTDADVQGDVPLGALHQFVRDAEDAAGAAFAQGRGNQGAEISRLARHLRSSMKEASPEFASASAIYRGARLDEEARTLGTRVFREGENRAQIERQLRDFMRDGPSQSERGQFLSGVLDAIENRVGTTRGEAGFAPSRLDNQAVRDRLAIVFGEEDAGAMARYIRRQGQQARTEQAASPFEGSVTETAQQATRRASEMAAGNVRAAAGDVVANPLAALSLQSQRANVQQVLQRGSPAERERLARLLTEPQSQESELILRLLEDLDRRAGVRTVGRTAGTAASVGATAEGTRRVNQ
jgi:hypothetical protein